MLRRVLSRVVVVVVSSLILGGILYYYNVLAVAFGCPSPWCKW